MKADLENDNLWLQNGVGSQCKSWSKKEVDRLKK